MQALRQMDGGMERILRMIWTAVIEDFNSLQPFLTFVTSNEVSEDEMIAFHGLFSATDNIITFGHTGELSLASLDACWRDCERVLKNENK